MTDGIGPIGLARRGVAALAALKDLDGAAPTPEQRAVIGRWPGWGPLATAFGYQTRPPAWQELACQIAALLSKEELEEAANAVDTAYYTPPLITGAVWDILTGLGFDGGRVLEPGCGAGYFMAAAPAGLDVQWTGVERDTVSAQIAAALHPGAEIIAGRLEKTTLPHARCDAVVANVPFGQAGPFDPSAPAGLSLHGYFLWRALNAVRPGGIVVAVTTRWTLDAAGAKERAELARLGAFVGAIRMPSCALAAAGTRTVADIVVFKRLAGAKDGKDEAWLQPAGHHAGVRQTTISRYFAEHPDMVLGTLVDKGGPQFGQTLDVIADPQKFPADLADVVRLLVKTGIDAGHAWEPAPDGAVHVDEWALTLADDGRYRIEPDGTITQQKDGRLVKVRSTPELELLIRLRDAALDLFAAETGETVGANERSRVRDRARALYKSYIDVYGPLNRSELIEKTDDDGMPYFERRSPRLGGFRADPDYVTVLALELWDDDTGTAKPAPILLRHVNRPPERKTATDDPAEALLLCLDATGRVDLDVIGCMLGADRADVPAMLAGQIWEDPRTGEWVTSDEYLSGNVRVKLEKARTADGDWARHIFALEEVQPADLEPEQINVQLGSPWVPCDVIEDFIAGALGVREWERDRSGFEICVRYAAVAAAWEVRVGGAVRKKPAATATFGTTRVNAVNLIEHALCGTMPTVTDPGEGDTRIKNPEETALAAERIRLLQETFATWVWSNAARTDRLARIYNDRFNSTRVRRYDGSLLTFPGLIGGFKPYQSQRDFVWRTVCAPADTGSLCGYSVGAGKTATMVLSAMTLKRLGMANKPCMVVPNHLLEQETAEARRLYPGARILMVTREDLTKERRRAFAAKVAARDWDLILMTHQQFAKLPVSPEVEAAFIAGLIDELDDALRAGGFEESRTAKQLATRKKRLEAKHEALLHADRDSTGVTFEQTGIDFIMIDEAHFFKNLEFVARAEGFQTGGSKRATDLLIKLNYLRDRSPDGRCGALYTGTPISNALSELHVLFRYLCPGTLDALGLSSFDAFAAQYIRYETATEVAPDGSGFRSYRRPRRYVNLPELRAMLGECADIRTKADLQLEGPEVVAEAVAVPAQPELADYTAELVQRADDIRNGGVDPSEDNMLAICSDGRRAALDLHLVGIVPTGPGKIEAAADRMAAIYRETREVIYPDPTGTELFDPAPGAFQLAFCDQGTPRKSSTQVYGRLKQALTNRGVPADEIAFVHDAETRPDRSALFAACRKGQPAIMIASTEKCGTGVNIQHRMAVIHHLDAPWRPADVDQRDGRGDRPHNGNQVLRIFRYVTEHSFDSYMWQALERKARFIAQILTGDLNVREVEDGGDARSLSFAELKAIATGQPLLLELAGVNAEVARLRNMLSGHKRSQDRMASERRYLLDDARLAEHQEAQYRAMATAAAEQPRELRTYAAISDETAVLEELARVLQMARETKRQVSAGQWRGVYVSFEAVWRKTGTPGVRVRLENTPYSRAEHEFMAWVAPWKPEGVEALFRQIDIEIDAAGDLADRAVRRGVEAKERAEAIVPYLDKEFPHLAALRTALAIRDELETEIDKQVKPDISATEPVASAA